MRPSSFLKKKICSRQTHVGKNRAMRSVSPTGRVCHRRRQHRRRRPRPSVWTSAKLQQKGPCTSQVREIGPQTEAGAQHGKRACRCVTCGYALCADLAWRGGENQCRPCVKRTGTSVLCRVASGLWTTRCGDCTCANPDPSLLRTVADTPHRGTASMSCHYCAKVTCYDCRTNTACGKYDRHSDTKSRARAHTSVPRVHSPVKRIYAHRPKTTSRSDSKLTRHSRGTKTGPI